MVCEAAGIDLRVHLCKIIASGRIADSGSARAQRRKQRVVAVEHGCAALLEAAEDLALGAQDILPAAQVSDVRVADICDHSYIRLGDADQIVDLAEVIHSHLQDRDLILRAQAENSHGKSQMVVEVARGLQRAEAAGEHGSHHILGRRLADASCNGNNRNTQTAPVIGRQIAHRLGCILNQHAEFSFRNRLRRCADKTSLRAGLHSAGHKTVRVETLADDRHEQIACCGLSAVCLHVGDIPVFNIHISKKLSADRFEDLFYIKLFHVFYFLVSVLTTL